MTKSKNHIDNEPMATPKNITTKIKSHHDFMWTYSKDLLLFLFRPAMIFLIFLGMSLMFLFASIFYWFEAGINPKLNSFFDAVYFSVSTMTTVGFGDITPVTFFGKVITVLMMVFLGLEVIDVVLVDSAL
ncbi:MAG: hypothetical protein H6623_05105 [Bdellovibrionaceae bacterium]|nr:hypothetical protein [Pseudobdellovibrionaceae bacterium]